MKCADILRHITGKLHISILDMGGNIITSFAESNLIVATGYKAAAEALAGVPGAAITRVAVGPNGTEPIGTDVAITDSVMVDIQSVEYPTDSSVRFHFSIGYDMAVGETIREFGLITADGRLFSRKVREGIEKNESMSIVGQWDINF